MITAFIAEWNNGAFVVVSPNGHGTKELQQLYNQYGIPDTLRSKHEAYEYKVFMDEYPYIAEQQWDGNEWRDTGNYLNLKDQQ